MAPVVMGLELVENGMSGLQEIITGSIEVTLSIYSVHVLLLAFTPKEATMSLVKSGPRCHGTRISRKRHVRVAGDYHRQHWGHLSYIRSEARRVGNYSKCRYNEFGEIWHPLSWDSN